MNDELVWEDPPKDPPTRAEATAKQLRSRPGEWARIDTRQGGLTFFPWWSPLSHNPEYEVKFAYEISGQPLSSPKKIYARYIGARKP